MNCKPGDLAVIVRSSCGSEGTIVRCLRLAEVGERFKSVCGTRSILMTSEIHVRPWWVVEQPINVICYENPTPVLVPIALDRNLRPLRPDEGEDETLTWAGKPNNVKGYAK